MKIDPNISIAKPPENPKLREISQQFEAMLINQMIGAMRQTVAKDGLVEESQGEKIYQSLLDTHYAGEMAESNQIGLADVVYEQLLRTIGQQW